MTELVEQYRLNADKCFECAQTFNDLDAKQIMFAMANAWVMLAKQRAKIETTSLNEPASRVNEPPPPIDDPPKPFPDNEPPRPPPVNDPPPVKESPPMRLNAAKPDDPMQC